MMFDITDFYLKKKNYCKIQISLKLGKNIKHNTWTKYVLSLVTLNFHKSTLQLKSCQAIGIATEVQTLCEHVPVFGLIYTDYLFISTQQATYPAHHVTVDGRD